MPAVEPMNTTVRGAVSAVIRELEALTSEMVTLDDIAW